MRDKCRDKLLITCGFLNKEMNQLEFAQTLQQLKDTARLQENMLTSEQISEAFEALSLTEEQMGLIHEYLNKNHIGIDEPAEQNANLSSEDTNYLNMYLEELKDLPEVSDGEKRAVMMSALAQDNSACNKLIEIFLPQVVEIAKLYAGQGALVEDLIGEGNVALSMGVTNCHNVLGLSTSIELDGGNKESQVVEKEPVKTGDVSSNTIKELGLLLTGSLLLGVAGFSMKEERHEEE